ncbi:MAG: thiamine phosphate synthase [Chloroflexi bacterium]|nr:thiamine phosphate synthase [Chloroflexota bacterium]
MDKAVLRILDANLNRAIEGLRVLEELARLKLDDAVLSQALKDLRHDIARLPDVPRAGLLAARDSQADIGRDIEAPGQDETRSLAGTVSANARRAQEALRVMEELARTPGAALEGERFRKARFAVYTLEKRLILRLARQDTIARLPGLHAVITGGSPDYVKLAGDALAAGAAAIHLRARAPERDLLPVALRLKEACARSGALLLVEERATLAAAAGASGAILKPGDLPPRLVRELIAADMIIGVAVSSPEQAARAAAEEADFLVAHIEDLDSVRAAGDLPLVAGGDISAGEAVKARRSGARAIAVPAGAFSEIAAACRQEESHGKP